MKNLHILLVTTLCASAVNSEAMLSRVAQRTAQGLKGASSRVATQCMAAPRVAVPVRYMTEQGSGKQREKKENYSSRGERIKDWAYPLLGALAISGMAFYFEISNRRLPTPEERIMGLVCRSGVPYDEAKSFIDAQILEEAKARAAYEAYVDAQILKEAAAKAAKEAKKA